MKLKLDENLPASLVSDLLEFGHDADSVEDEGLAGRKDDAIWQAATGENRFLITQDLDFSDARKFTPGTHPGILLVRLHEPGRKALTRKILELFRSESVESWRGCIVVATDQKLRVRRPA